MLLNVSYGKLIEKLHLIKTNLVNKDELDNYMRLHFEHILEVCQISDNKY